MAEIDPSHLQHRLSLGHSGLLCATRPVLNDAFRRALYARVSASAWRGSFLSVFDITVCFVFVFIFFGFGTSMSEINLSDSELFEAFRSAAAF